MPHTPKKFDEWFCNEILYVLYAIKEEKKFMLIFQEHDLEDYLDTKTYRINTDFEQRSASREVITDAEINVDNFCQKFRADAVLINDTGKPFIVEVKREQSMSVESCNELVLQTLLYANIVLNPAYYDGDEKIPITPYNKTRDFLDLLARAHWFSRIYDKKLSERYLSTIEEQAKHVFDKKIFCVKKSICGVIFAISNPGDELFPILLDSCQLIKSYNFNKYREKASFNKSSRFLKRIKELQHNWQLLQSISFHFLPINLNALEQIIGEPRELK